MSITPPSDPREVQEFQFKLICRLNVFNQKDEEYRGFYNLIAPASKYGLLFVGCGNQVQAILLPHVLEIEQPAEQVSSRRTSRGTAEIQNYPRREFLLPDIVTNLNVNCDQSLLAIATAKEGCAHALIYDVASFHGKAINLVKEVRLATSPDAHLLELSWNPGIANILASCLSNGTVTVYEFKNGGVDINTLPPEAQATCFSWSPKGKQLVVGSLNGTLTQYKPDLKAVKSIAAPNVFENPSSVLNVLWISNYQFAAVYKDSLNESERPSLLIVNAPKTGGNTFVNYEDICFSSGDLRKPQFYLLHQQSWNVLMVGSANSMEIGVLGLTSDQLTWEQWLQEDASRAELPLSLTKEETFPLGVALDTSTQKQLPLNENQVLPPMPVLAILSHRGVLCLFFVINTLPGAVTVCSPPEQRPEESGLAYFITSPASGDETLNVVTKESISSPQQALTNTPQSSKPLQWTTPSGVVDINRTGLRINLTEKFENIAPSQPLSAAKPAFSFNPGEPTQAVVDAPDRSNAAAVRTLKVGANPAPLMGSGSLFAGVGTQQQLSLGQSSKENTTALANILATPGQSNTAFNISITPAATSTPNLFGVKPLQIQQQSIESQKHEQMPLNFQQQTFHQPFFQPQVQQQQIHQQQQQIHQQQTQFLQPQLLSQLQSHQSLQQQQQQQQQQSASLPKQSPPQLQQQIQQHPLVQRNAQIQQSENSVSSNKQLSNLFGSLEDAKVASNSISLLSGTTDSKQTLSVAIGGSNSDDADVARQTEEIINSSSLYLAVQKEMDHFENKISELKARLGKINMEVGTTEEKTLLRKRVDAMDNFCQELQKATCDLSSEVRALKAEMVESLAWVEDARSRADQENDPCWLQVVHSQELDPVSARYLANVKQLSYYVETQLCQADRSLELQWANFQESCRDKIKGRLYIPSLEAVYQAMVLQSNILLKQKANVKRIMERAAKHKMAKSGSLSGLRTNIASVQSRSDTNLAALAENLLQMRLGAAGSSAVGGEDISEIMAAGRYSMVATMTHKLTPQKQSTLREYFTQGPVRHIKPIKPVNSLKHFSLLEQHSKSQAIKTLKPTSVEASPLGFLGKMVARMSSDNLNSFKIPPSTSVPKEKADFNVGAALRKNLTVESISSAGEVARDCFGQIEQSVVTKFKEPAPTAVAASIPDRGSENIKTKPTESSMACLGTSTTNKENFSFSFTPSVSLANVGRMSSDNLNGFKTAPLTSVPKEKAGFNIGAALKENLTADSISAAGETADLFGQIAKSVVTKFKEPAPTAVAAPIAGKGSENIKTKLTGSSAANLDSLSTNKENLPFSFTSSIPPPSIARMSSDNSDGFKTAPLTSIPKEKADFSIGATSKEDLTVESISAAGETTDLFGQIAKSVVTKFKEPDSTATTAPIPGRGSENIKTKPSSTARLDNSTTNKENLSFSFTPSISPANVPTSKSKGTVNFSFNSSSKQPTTPFGEGLAKSNSATSFNFQLPATSSASSVFSGTTSKPSGFNFFSSSSTATTSAPVQFFGSLPAETFSTTGTTTITTTTSAQNTFTFSSPSVSTTVSGTSLPPPFGTKSVFGQSSLTGATTAQITKTTQGPSVFGGATLSNSSANFSFLAPTASSSNQSTPVTKSIFGGVQPKTTVETATPDSSSENVGNKTGTSTLTVFSTPVSVTSTSIISTASDFNLGQLNSALTSVPVPTASDASKEGGTTQILEPSSTNASVSSSSVSTSSVAATSSTPTKSFTFSLSNVPSSSVPSSFGAKIATPDDNNKNKIPSTSAPVSFFEQAVCSPTSFSQNTSNIFGQSPSSIFGGNSPSAASTSNVSEEKKVSANTSVVSSTASTLAVEPSETTVETAAGTRTPVTSSSVFSVSSLASSFPTSETTTASSTTAAAAAATTTPTTTTPTTSAAAVITTTATSAASSFFGNAVTSSLFGNSSTTSSPILGGTTMTSAPGFGSNTSFFSQTNTTSGSIFKPQESTSITPGFGQSTTTSAGSVFGQAATNTTSVFGPAAVTTSASIFGQAPGSTTASVFGQPNVASTASAFGQQTVSTTSVFGQTTTTAAPVATASVFGQTAATPTTSVFGQASTATGTSLFGQQATTTEGSVFGLPAVTTSTSVFGSGSSAIFGQPAATTSTNVFGQAVPSSTLAFGGVSNAFGQSSGSFMGGATQPTFGSSPTFGQSGGSIFGQSSGPGFGTSGGSMFGGSSTFGKAGNLFQSPSGGSIFGGNSSSGSSAGGAFSAPQGQSIAESGFGSPTTFGQNKPGFGSPPPFGQTSGGSGFGGSPTFGGAPTFGGSPIFGGQNRVFGSSSPPNNSSIFGGNNSQQQTNTFENLANQNTMTFGNLASGQSPTFGSSGGSVFGGTSQPQAPAFQNTSTFGGSSFSSWR